MADRTASAAIAERIRRLEGGGLRTFLEAQPLVWARARGAWVEDADGDRYLDLYAGYAVAATGYGHPMVVEAVRRQAAELMHCPSAHPSLVRAEFLEALAGVAPAGLERILPAVTGAMANELAVAVARTRRPLGSFVTFHGSYFGRSAGVVGLAGKARYREALALPATGHFVPFPDPYRLGASATDVSMDAVETFGSAAGGGGTIAAVVVEPILGNGGVVIPPDDFLPRLRAFCDQTGALLIVDEIQSGCGRTGRMWAIEHAGVVPDLMTVGKGIGGGMGVAAVLGRADVLTWPADTYTSTFLTNGVSLAAATAAIRVMRQQGLAARSRALGATALATLADRVAGCAVVGDVRGRGLWIGIEFVDEAGAPNAAVAKRVQRSARVRGVLVGRGGADEHVVKLSPPLVIEEDDLARGIEIVADCIQEAAARGETEGDG